MATPYISEIKLFGFNFAPKGWALCNGQLLPIDQNQALFSLLGTTYGGDGRVNFALPSLQGRVPMHFGEGFSLGEVGGEQAHTLLSTEMPGHTHPANGSTAAATVLVPTGNLLATTEDDPYAPTLGGPATLNPGTVAATGGGQPHENRQPFLVLSACIALTGIFPTQS